jgi:hypothetical protein
VPEEKSVRGKHPVWEVYDALRTACYEKLYYTARLSSVQKAEERMELALAFFVPGSAIAAFTVWKTSYGAVLWSVATAVATLISVAKPFLKGADRIRMYNESVVRFSIAAAELSEIRSLIAQKEAYDAELAARFAVANRNLIGANEHAPRELQEAKLQERMYAQVNREFPKEQFFVPSKPEKGPADSKTESDDG